MCNQHSNASRRLLQLSQLVNGTLKSVEDNNLHSFEDLERLSLTSSQEEVDSAIRKFSSVLESIVQRIKRGEGKKAPMFLNNINEMVRKAWAVPAHGHELG